MTTMLTNIVTVALIIGAAYIVAAYIALCEASKEQDENPDKEDEEWKD